MTRLASHLTSAQHALTVLWMDQLRWLIPVDPRGIVLGSSYVWVAALGLVELTNSDSLGYGYVLGALTGCLFIQTRVMTTFLWSLFAVNHSPYRL